MQVYPKLKETVTECETITGFPNIDRSKGG